MKKVAIKVIAASALSALVSAPAVFAAEATVGADVLSAYVFRGATVNENFVAQPYLDVSGLPIDIGVWANYDIESDDARGYEDNQFSEVDFYASYSLPIEAVDVAIGYTEYMYPGLGGGAEIVDGVAVESQGESDREVSISLGLGETFLAPSLGVYYGVDGGIDQNLYAQFDLAHDIALSEEFGLSLGAAVGYLDPEDSAAEDGFSHYQVSASIAYDILTVGITYVDTIDDDVLGDAYDVEFIGSVGVAYDF